MPTLLRYLLFQLPGWILVVVVLLLLREHFRLPRLVEIGIVVAWLAKDVLLYRLVRPAYVVDPRSQLDKLVGATAVVRRSLEPAGFVMLRGELWRAVATGSGPLPIPEGTEVRVVGGNGLSLIVEREAPDGRFHLAQKRPGRADEVQPSGAPQRPPGDQPRRIG